MFNHESQNALHCVALGIQCMELTMLFLSYRSEC